LSFEIYHPKNNVHNQDVNHDDNKIRITIFFFFELTDNDGQNFLAGIVLHIIFKNFGLNLSKMFVLTEIIDCIFLLFSKILSSVLSISPLY
jgi:hypothetical protein